MENPTKSIYIVLTSDPVETSERTVQLWVSPENTDVKPVETEPQGTGYPRKHENSPIN